MSVLSLLVMLSDSSWAASVVTLTPENSAILRGVVSQQSMSQLTTKLLKLDAARVDASKPIYLVIDSPGGSISAGSDFIQLAKTIPNLQTVTIFGASMAAGIVEALPGKRLIAENGTLMFHRASGGVEGQLERGELESRLGYVQDIVRDMEQTNSKRINMSLELYKSLVKDEWWLYGSKALDSGAADDIVQIRCSPELLKTKEKQWMTVFIFTMEVEMSACPLIKDGTVADKSEKAKEQFETYQRTYRFRGISNF